VTPIAIQEAFAFQSKACANLGSPFMGQLMALCATRDWPAGPIKDRIFTWQGDIGPAGQSVPLRLAGALHALHLQGHPTLDAVYPPKQPTDDALWDAVSTVLVEDADHIHDWINSAPQTNEVRRAATLMAVGHVLADRYNLPMRTSELGASGGLNLHWDSYAMALGDTTIGNASPALTLRPDWSGPRPPATLPTITSRAGVDLNPLDPSSPTDALRLQAYLWPDQPERLTLTQAAMSVAKTKVARGDAVTWLAGRLSHKPGALHLIYSTVAWQYFPKDAQDYGAHLIAQAGKQASEHTPLAWFGMENDGAGSDAALTLRLWPGDITIDLGRADFHGRWIKWNGV
jgi:hypothetical protein